VTPTTVKAVAEMALRQANPKKLMASPKAQERMTGK